MTIGKRIAKCRKEKNYSQEYIAELLDVSRQAVSKWETDQTEPDTGNLIKLAKVFNVSVEYLANGENQTEKIIFVEKKLPIFEIIGLIFLSLGGLVTMIGIFIPLLLLIGVFVIIFGILLIFLKKDGAILCVCILSLSVLLFIVQGIFWGIDNYVVCLIVSLSTLLPLLTYVVFKAIFKIKRKEFCKRLFDNQKIIKKIIFIGGTLIIVLTITIVLVVIVSNNRNEKWEKQRWFDESTLSDCLVSQLPKPQDTKCINVNRDKMLMYLDGNQYHAYALNIYNYLKNQKFKHLGTQGDFLDAIEQKDVYEFITDNGNYQKFLFDDDDFKFIYSNSEITSEGFFDSYVIYLNYVGDSTIVVGNKEYFYNIELTVEQNHLDYVYKYRSYSIIYDNYYKDLFVDVLQSESLPGKEMYFSTKCVDEFKYKVLLNGEILDSYLCENGILFYKFIMPNKKAVIDIEIEDENQDENEPKLKDYCDWLNVISVNNIKSLEITYAKNFNDNISKNEYLIKNQLTKDITIINSILSDYQNIYIKKIETELTDEYIDSTVVTFLLNDDSTYRLKFINNKYIEINNDYYEASVIPTLLPYFSEQILDFYSLCLTQEVYNVYFNNEIVAETDMLSDLKFSESLGEKDYSINECKYKIVTEIGELYIYNNNEFIFVNNIDQTTVYYELLKSSFDEILTI